MVNLIITIVFSLAVTAYFVCNQICFFRESRKFLILFRDFFNRKNGYEKITKFVDGEGFPQIVEVGIEDSDLNALIRQINNYLIKTKGTSDFSMIQNKVERRLNMRYDQGSTHIAFPTYYGLMGTFAGVFLGIFMFLWGFDDAGNISDESIQNLLAGILVSMLTSLFGLWLTTKNNRLAGEARKKIEEDKNDFYDFIQTELMPSINSSMVSAIEKLHQTVDNFEPAFNSVINRFQKTFDSCTKSFGNDFEKNVKTVALAVNSMGQNMDKINENVQYQKELVQTMQSQELVKGMDKYIEAAHEFVSITQSLNKFEEARRMMLAAAQEAINVQNAYNDSLTIPMNVAIGINNILDRVTKFEQNLDKIAEELRDREILGNDVINLIQAQVEAIGKKQRIADSFGDKADHELEEYFSAQTKAINELTVKYKLAISSHADSFEQMIETQKQELEKRFHEFVAAMEQKLSIEEIRTEFTNLEILQNINEQITDLSINVENIYASALSSNDIKKVVVSADDIKKAVADVVSPLKQELLEIQNELKKKENQANRGGLWPFGNR